MRLYKTYPLAHNSTLICIARLFYLERRYMSSANILLSPRMFSKLHAVLFKCDEKLETASKNEWLHNIIDFCDFQ